MSSLGGLWLDSLAVLWCLGLLLTLFSNHVTGCSVELDPGFSWAVFESVQLLVC